MDFDEPCESKDDEMIGTSEGSEELSEGEEEIENSGGKELTMGEDGGTIENSDGKLVLYDVDVDIEPYEGLEFASEDIAIKFYYAYAKRTGFVVRVGSHYRSSRDRKVTSRRLLCNREGFRSINNNKIRRQKQRAITREGCKARILIRKQMSGRWVVARFMKDHNHTLSISSGKVSQDLLQSGSEDAKDKKIEELSAELQHERQRCATIQEQLDLVLKDIEEHGELLSERVLDIVHNMRTVEFTGQELSHPRNSLPF